VVVEAATPLALSHLFGEGGGVMLALGDHNPAPGIVTSLDPLIELAPSDCSGATSTSRESVGTLATAPGASAVGSTLGSTARGSSTPFFLVADRPTPRKSAIPLLRDAFRLSSAH
jgi:hypothetical protein